ncbi:DUF1566 domain-containing protein [Ochrobactrum sp. AN78]|uniref:Lcl C-terminal domain-containing protein n=1 Tax=Ochrobactrum sp. AN78 TaxID=3039853 RepID=UPI002989B7DF|nr:DUF1566 domain-containing protein [Ochrobactrum sp. AN78]MDH7793549.1 hypothetical protein [Ochrobactrum sp. AN78]
MRIPAIMMTTLVSLLSMGSANACTDSPKTRLEIRQDVGIDKKAKLIWKRCALGMHWSAREKTCRGEADAFTHSEAEVQAAKSGRGWRLPTVDELATLLQTTCSGPQLEKGLFPDIEKADFGEGENFWSST